MEKNSTHPSERLKIALLLQSKNIPAHQASFIRDILKDSRFEVIGYFILKARRQHLSLSPALKSKLWAFLARRFLYRQMDALKLTNLSAELSSISEINANLLNHSFGLDVLIDCQDSDIPSPLLTLPRFGTWRFHYNHENPAQLAPTGFWEFYFKNFICSACLYQLTPSGHLGKIIRKGSFATDLLSLAKTQNKILYESAAWIKSSLAELWNNPHALNDHPGIHCQASKPRYPNLIHLVNFLLKFYGRQFANFFHKTFFFTAWNVAIVPTTPDKITNKILSEKAQWLPQLTWPKFQADPFGMEVNGEFLVFLEEGNHSNAVGEIKTITLSTSLAEKTRAKVTTQFKYHHSYPFLFHENGGSFMLPECLQSKQLTLYKLCDLSGQVKEHARLLSGLPVVDPSLVYFNNRYWLFCTLWSPYTDSCTSLYIFHSQTLEGPYEPHLLNPVKSDARSSRPAGAFFFKEGKLHRPAQDCSRTYGGGVSILEIQKLSPTEFSERLVDSLTPHPQYPQGLHSISPLGKNHTLTDGKRYAFTLEKALAKIKAPKTVFPLEELETLKPIQETTKLSNYSEISQQLLSSGIDADCWCAKKVDLAFKYSAKASQLVFKIDFPGWQKKRSQRLKILVNDKMLLKVKLKQGVGTIALPLANSGPLVRLSILATSKFRMPFPDNRSCAFQLCELNFTT